MYDPNFGYYAIGAPVALVVIPLVTYTKLHEQRLPQWIIAIIVSLVFLISAGTYFILVQLFTSGGGASLK